MTEPSAIPLAVVAGMAGVTPEKALRLARKWNLPISRRREGIFVDGQDVCLVLGAIRHNRKGNQ
jgi:hypothetical protein